MPINVTGQRSADLRAVGTPSAGGTSRREFIKRVIASGAVASSASFMAGGLAACTAQRASVAGGVERLLTLNVNGQPRRVDVLPQETLAMTLRYKLGLTGTKLACDRAECGACTVLIDDVSLYACSTLTHSVRARKVVTIEGIRGPNGELHPVQRAFVEELSPQCGFCTPGQVMAAVALLHKNPKPTREEARHAMSGNLCRCGAYDNYLNGVMRACGNVQEIHRGTDLGPGDPGHGA
jgi:aerobic-type carbon monoxide dehydrogenase small subunit (CoxS/CutS family)